jgi:hypothetical protein
MAVLPDGPGSHQHEHVLEAVPAAASKQWQRIGRSLLRTVRSTELLLLLVVLIPVLAVQAYHYFAMFQERRQQAFQSNLELARVVSGAMDEYVSDVLHQELAIGLAFASPSISDADAFRLLSLNAQSYPSVRNMSWVDTQGNIVASSSPNGQGITFADRPYFRAILQGREWSVSELFQGRLSGGEPTFTINRGIRDDQGRLIGVMVAGIDPARLDDLLQAERVGKGAVAIIDSSGTLVYRRPEADLTWDNRNLGANLPFLSRALAGQEVTDTFTSPVDNQERIAGLTPIPSIRWVAMANQPLSEALRPVEQDLARDSSLLALVALGAFGVALAISRNITGPIHRLREHALAIGRGEAKGRVDVAGPEEMKSEVGKGSSFSFTMPAA